MSDADQIAGRAAEGAALCRRSAESVPLPGQALRGSAQKANHSKPHHMLVASMP
jgi:hypothetical protein